MSMLIRSGECKKFAPNIFNKTKCTNCFRQKEEHSAEALESNRATRKVAKCGYLFVAPGWDFSNPVNRTKRWQRRWFVLYDDGELSYSLDEHPETVPQACIDMNKVLEVADAEDLTGNPYSLSITTPEVVHFVKATSREEAKWWMDVLSVFPRSKGRHKRNVTYPVSKAVTNMAVANNGALMQPSVTTRTGFAEIPNNRDLIEDSRSRRNPSREKKTRSNHSFADDISKMLPNWHDKKPEMTRRLILDELEADCKLKDLTDSLSRPQSRHSTSSFSSSNLESLKDMEVSSHKQVRGDPDGCGLDLASLRYSPSAELRVDTVSEDLLNIKKGWLMKQCGPPDQDWNKYWFVLRGAALLYYRDPTAEDQGILDGVIDLSVMSSINEVQVARNYGFQIKTWDERNYTLSAVTAGIRGNWIIAIKRAGGIHDEVDNADKDLPSTPRSLLLSSDDEYRTASENGRQSSSDWGETLPPSPPLNRTPISKVKERARGVTRTRLYNSRNSKSSPPSSRRSTLDSVVRHQDILSAYNEATNLEKNERTSLMKKLEKQAIELEEVKRQLTSALRQLSSAEEELLRLRQRQQDVKGLEKQLADMVQSLQKAEDALKQKTNEASEIESLKKRYMDEKSSWQNEMRNAECELHETEERYSELCCELASSRKQVDQLRNELSNVSERLSRGIEENEALYRRLRELEGRGTALHVIRESKGRSLDSFSDLTNIDMDLDFEKCDKERIVEEYEELRARFEKAVHEIRAMKRELKESHDQTDCLEINLINARQDLKCKQQAYESQASMMAARIQDLTNKLSAAEKQVRMLKQKICKSETREKRRSLSLKGRESSAMCKELEEKLLQLEKKIAMLDAENAEHFAKAALTGNRVRRKSLDSATSIEPMKILIRMNSLEAKVTEASKRVVIEPSSPCETLESTPEESDGYDAISEVRNIESLLRSKLVELHARQKKLQEADALTDEAKLNITAEKLAYESVLVRRLQEIAGGGADIAHAERLITELDRKLKGDLAFDYFSASLTEYLRQIGRLDGCAKPVNVGESSKMLLKKSNALAKRVEKFVRDSDVRLDRDRLVDMVREEVDRKLIQVEVRQIMMHCADKYADIFKNDKAFESLTVNRANIEQWSDTVHKILKSHVESALSKIREKYDSCGSKIKSPQSEDSSKQLQQFVDILAHQCLLDARILIIREKDIARSDKDNELKLDEAAILSEVQYLYTKIQSDLKGNAEEKRVFDSLESVGTEVSALRNSVEDLVRRRSSTEIAWDSNEKVRMDDSGSIFDSGSSQSSWYEGVCRRCSEIKEQIINLQTCLMQSQECQKCLFLQEQIKKREIELEENKQQLEVKQMQEIANLRLEFENERNLMIAKHEEEEKSLKERAKKLEKRLGCLDSEYSQQMDCIRSAYQRTPSPEYEKDCHISEECIQQRYQAEIEHLRALCEKGLVAMDISHKRTIAELEEKHKQEIESMRIEKEQALAEETQATLSALDAMRKAHEAEVQKEIAKFKTEFMKKMQCNHDINSMHSQHEAEMEEIKEEILSLSEKYSIKCVESAALEEELRTASSQLAQAQNHIMQLDNRNKQLRAHLMSESTENLHDEELLNQLEERKKQICSLQEQLSAHDDTLKALCMHLSNGHLDNSTLNLLLEKLQDKKFMQRALDEDCENMNSEEKEVNFMKNRFILESAGVNLEFRKYRKDTRRTRRSPSPCSVSGMVAERKKIFEP